jgi:D-alanyl-lipoteichoic acid acyltransferase DltB (MBOAT superfamily)
MLFNSFEFLAFFPIVTLLYYAAQHQYRWFILLFASCIFYMAFVPIYLLIIVATILIDFAAGIWIHNSTGANRKLMLVLSLIANIGVLFVFKYYNFFITNLNDAGLTHAPLLQILLPVGLSFHTFQAMSYTIEVYRGNQEPERHLGIYALYVLFYPQLVAGPIERPQNILHQFRTRHKFSYYNVSNGLKLMAWGMFKKAVIADNIAIYVNHVYAHYADFEGITLIIAVILFSFQIYFDFSGYSDIALGSAQSMGFSLMQNFNRPYQSKGISEFWSRWHISLSTWFRDYLYIPLGGNKKGKFRRYLNQFIVFVVSGFWHGANWTFIIWGGIHAFFVMLENLTKKSLGNLRPYTFLQVITTFMVVSIAWVFFRANTVHDALQIIGSLSQNIPSQIHRLVTDGNVSRLEILYANKSLSLLLTSFIGIAFVLLIEWRQKGLTTTEYFATLSKPNRVLLYLLLIYSCVFMTAGKQSQFIYFQF